MSRFISKSAIIGMVWGFLSIFGAISGMVNVSGKQSSVSGSWVLDAIIFLPSFLSWQLTKILPENIVSALIVLVSPIIIGFCFGKVAEYLYGKLKNQ